MTNEEILNRINDYLGQHISGVRGYIRQQPYIGDLFTLFAAAYANRETTGSSLNYITSDGLVAEVSSLSQGTDSAENHQKKLGLLHQLGEMWREWDFAWEMYPQFYHDTE